MAEGPLSGVWTHRGLFAGLVSFWLFLRILPLSTLPAGWPGPDLLVCLTFAWVLRRPDYVPALLIFAVFLLEDMLTMRPPGLWTLIVLLGSEFLRNRELLTRQLPFALEWVMVAAVILLMLLAQRLVMSIVMAEQTSFGFAFVQIVLTILCYPLVVAVSRLAFGIRKAATGEMDARGRRL